MILARSLNTLLTTLIGRGEFKATVFLCRTKQPLLIWYFFKIYLQTVLRIWDCLFYEGSKVILRVALTLMSLHKEKLMACHDFAELCEVMKVCICN